MKSHLHNQIILSIVIPTFNRHSSLLSSIKLILPQLNKKCELIIFDNHSNPSVSESLKKTFKSKLQFYRVIKNISNVGGSENILRSIEGASGSYIWVLSDDDPPKKNAISIILNELKKNKDVRLVNFYKKNYCHDRRVHDRHTYGSLNYLESTNSLGELIFISNLIFKRSEAIKHLYEAYFWQSCSMPQLILSIFMLRNSGHAILSKSQIVSEPEVDKKDASILPVAQGLISLFFIKWTHEEFLILRKKRLWFGPLTIMNQLLFLANSSNEHKTLAVRYASNIFYSTKFKPFNLVNRFAILLFGSLLRFNFFVKFLTLLSKGRKNNVDYDR